MIDILKIVSFLISFIIVYTFLPKWIKRAKTHNLVGKDVHKKNKKKVAESGGIIVISGAIVGLLFYIALRVFYYKIETNVPFILAAVCSILIALIIGFVDDILGWKIGIRQRHKILLSVLIAFPMMVVNSGHNIIHLPFLDEITLGVIYPLILIPIAITGTSNAFNMLGGYNGLETGQGIIILSSLGFLAWLTGSGWVTMIALCTVFSLLAFLRFNWFPASIFPGDTLTYPIGAVIGIIAILANIEKFAIIIFFLYYIEFLLKATGKMKQESFADLNKDNTLSNNGRFYTLPHIAIFILNKLKIRSTERNVVISILFMQLIISAISLSYYFCC